MIRIIHVSDLHFGKNAEGNQQAGRLLGAVRSAYRFGAGYHNYLLVTGDIVDDGRKQQFQLVETSALRGFRNCLLMAPGNHDYAEEGTIQPASGAPEYFDTTFLPVFGIQARYREARPAVRVLDDGDGNRVLTVGLNSARIWTWPFCYARGKIGDEQLDRLESALTWDTHAGLPCVVYLHHRPESVGPFMDLVDREALLQVVADRADILAYGHSGGVVASPPAAPGGSEVHGNAPVLLDANASVPTTARNPEWFEIRVNGGMVHYERIVCTPAWAATHVAQA